jgi:hypothetical protein
VHKILVVIEPLLIDEDYYARVEGREIIANLSKAAGECDTFTNSSTQTLRTEIATMPLCLKLLCRLESVAWRHPAILAAALPPGMWTWLCMCM